ncbi:MAG: hypothetical protein GXC94_13080 [Comamonadaceae bacterium]|nr:hypothetical protein [Comamonadaceae bacterium]
MVSRYQVGQKCAQALAGYCNAVVRQRLHGTEGSVEMALLALRDQYGPSRQHTDGAELVAALARVGIVVERITGDVEDRECPLRVVFQPALLHMSFRRLPQRASPRFAFRLDARPPKCRAALAGGRKAEDSRYAGGISDADQLRMQVEILRQDLEGFNLSVDAALDELCQNATDPRVEALERCDQLSLALGEIGLRFQPALKSWRLPRAGVLVLSEPDKLVRAYPHLAFFEPDQFLEMPVVDRPARAGKVVNQGLLF